VGHIKLCKPKLLSGQCSHLLENSPLFLQSFNSFYPSFLILLFYLFNVSFLFFFFSFFLFYLPHLLPLFTPSLLFSLMRRYNCFVYVLCLLSPSSSPTPPFSNFQLDPKQQRETILHNWRILAARCISNLQEGSRRLLQH
jgi:hypothetical protein